MRVHRHRRRVLRYRKQEKDPTQVLAHASRTNRTTARGSTSSLTSLWTINSFHSYLGLHTEPNRRTQNTTLEEGYEDLRKSASKFLTIQIGISTFKFDPSNGSYLAKPFNIFVFPTTLTGYSPQGRCFLTEASSLDFLAKNRFDFNKWVYQGTPIRLSFHTRGYAFVSLFVGLCA